MTIIYYQNETFLFNNKDHRYKIFLITRTFDMLNERLYFTVFKPPLKYSGLSLNSHQLQIFIDSRHLNSTTYQIILPSISENVKLIHPDRGTKETGSFHYLSLKEGGSKVSKWLGNVKSPPAGTVVK